jgi:transposase
MGREELDGLGREALVELILRQGRELAEREAEVAEQREVIAQRDARVRELEDEVARLSLPAKTPENSSVPPSRGQKANAGLTNARCLSRGSRAPLGGVRRGLLGRLADDF